MYPRPRASQMLKYRGWISVTFMVRGDARPADDRTDRRRCRHVLAGRRSWRQQLRMRGQERKERVGGGAMSARREVAVDGEVERNVAAALQIGQEIEDGYAAR